VSDQRLSRRSALARLARVGGAGLAVSILTVVPEARGAFGSYKTPTIGASQGSVTDPAIRRLIAEAKNTREWQRYRTALVSDEPTGVATPPDGPTLLAFAAWDTDQAATEARRVEPFQLLQAVVFAFERGGVTGAVLMIPTADLTATVVQDLRSSQSKTVQHSAAARATLEAARDKAIEIKRLRMAADGRAMTLKTGKFTFADAGGCNCGTSRLYSCNQVVTGGGYWDAGCLFGCSISCTFGTSWCWAACSVGCWVAPYSYCASYSCTMCAW
jgi:hypothetical protein